jgi:hypothetical protein
MEDVGMFLTIWSILLPLGLFLCPLGIIYVHLVFFPFWYVKPRNCRQVYGIQKRYRPEKHYVFILKITRENEKEATFLFRQETFVSNRNLSYST